MVIVLFTNQTLLDIQNGAIIYLLWINIQPINIKVTVLVTFFFNVKSIRVVNKQKSNDNSTSGLSEDGYSYYPSSGPAVDSAGKTRDYAIANNWHYILQTIDGKDAGVYVPYDSKAGCYHT